MHPLVPGFIQDCYLKGETSGQFQAAGLFLDISGFSTITDALMAHGQHGAEVMAQVMRAIFDPIITYIFAQGGFVASSAGDSLTALFPLGDDARDGSLRALAAAWSIQEQIARLGSISTPYQQVQIVARVGLAEGAVQWGIITASARQGVYYFQGPAIDDSALAQQQAKAGQIVLTAPLAAGLEAWITAAFDQGGFVRLERVTTTTLPAARTEIPPPTIIRQALAQFYPAEVIDLEISGEFRHVVNLLVSLPAAHTEAQLHIFMGTVFALQNMYGGLISRLDFGDKGTNLLIFWGAPAAYENDIERALNFILSLQASTSIPISAGMTYGIAHAGFIGGRLYEEYTCLGRGVSLAARLMTGAPRGEIWIDEAITRRAGRSFEIERIGERRFKGFSHPQVVYMLLERKELAGEMFQASLVGRQVELAALSGFLQPIFEGRFAGLLVVSGEPGIGKSRLVHAFLESLQDDRTKRFQVFLGQTDEIVRQPFNPFVYWLQRYFGINEAQGEARSKRNFNRKLDALIAETKGRLAEEIDRTRSFLGALVGLRWADSLYEQLDAQGRYNNTLIALAALLQVESQRAPVVLVLEDIHQLDEDSLACLPYLMRVLAAQVDPVCPVALLCTSRDSLEELGSAVPGSQDLRLRGLDRVSLRELVMTRLGGPPAGSLLDLLEARAEGNPFYAEHILLYMKEEGLLVREEAGWNYQPGLVSALPVDVHAMLVARLDHLAHEVKEVVQTAAILGREFDVHLLSCMLANCEPPVELAEVATAEQQGIWAKLNDNRYLFRHILMREAAYQMQVHTRQQRLHALALEAYETLYAGNLPVHYGELVYHAEQARLVDAARRYLRLAGEAARDAYQNGLASDYFSRALALTPESDIEERCELLLAREGIDEAMGANGERQYDLQALEVLRPALEQVDVQVEILLRQALYAGDMGQYEVADVTARQAQALARLAGLVGKESRACYTQAVSALRRGRLEQAETDSREALHLAIESGSAEDEFYAWNILGLTATDQGRLEEARQAFTRCLEIARGLGRLSLQIAPLNNIANIARMQGDLASGLAFYEQAVETARQTGDRSREGMALGNLGFVAGLLGEYRLAMGYLEQSLQLNREGGQTLHVTYGLINLSACAGALGDFATAEGAASEANKLAQTIEDRSGEAWALTYMGHSLLARGALNSAAGAYSAALEIRRALEQPDLATEPAAGLARAALEQGNLPAALSCLDPVLAYLAGGGSLEAADEPLRVYLTGFLVLEQARDPRALVMLETAHRLLHERAANIQRPETRQAFLSAIAHHREIQSAWEQRQER